MNAQIGREAALIYIDGASWGNPGPAGVGVVIQAANGRPGAQLSKYLGEATNNVAEYAALLYALAEAQARGLRRVMIRTDSELLARQINGDYRVRDGTLRLLHDLAKHLMRGFAQCTVEHVSRNENTQADRLATEAVEGRMSSITMEGKRAEA